MVRIIVIILMTLIPLTTSCKNMLDETVFDKEYEKGK